MEGLQIFLLAIFLLYAIFIVRFLKNAIRKAKKAASEKELANKYDPFARKDINKWNILEIYFCGIFLLPLRLIAEVSSFILCGTICGLACIGADTKKELSSIRKFIIKQTTRLIPRIILFSAGFHYISVKRLSIKDIDPSYVPSNTPNSNNKRAPIIVSNHITFFDICAHMCFSDDPSFLAKKDVANYPFIGTAAKSMQGLFVDRGDKGAKDNTMQLIFERTEKILKGSLLPSIVIFPEGTTTNGEYLISFKKGAFAPLAPIRIMCLKYNNPNFNPSMDVLGTGLVFLLTLCMLNNSLTIYDLGIFDPAYLNLKSEDDWKIYAEKVKNIMINTLKCKSSELGFSDKSLYFKELREGTKKSDQKT